ncbi:FkbM family methyltransferase [Helicobacter sp. 23-1044]
METFLEYLERKITRKAPDMSKVLFSSRVKQNIFFRIALAPYKLVIALKNAASSAYNSDLQKRIALLTNATIDPNGLGKIDLMLHNAHIPKRYYEIFYKLPLIVQNSKMQIGGGRSDKNGNFAESRTKIAESTLDSAKLDSAPNSANDLDSAIIAIDCGAHAGLVTDLFLHFGLKVHSFEPNAYLHAILAHKYRNNPSVILNKSAVSNKCGKTKFLLHDATSQGNALMLDNMQVAQTQEYDEVEVIDLVEYIARNILPQRIFMLKLDVEGAEFDIMDKIIATKLYEKIDYIACETHERYFKDGKEKIKNLRAKIKQNNIKNIFLDWI